MDEFDRPHDAAYYRDSTEPGWESENDMDGNDDDYMDRDLIDGVGFASEGSALRAATRDNPRSLPCPTCGEPNRLTPIDVQRGYQCDGCADRAEGRYGEY